MFSATKNVLAIMLAVTGTIGTGVGCVGGPATDEGYAARGESSESPCAAPATRVSSQLKASELVIGTGMEQAANPVKTAELCTAAGSDDRPQFSEAELQKLRDDDKSWQAADGTRYEAMLVLTDGTAFGRRGAAPNQRVPDKINNFGGNAGDPPAEFPSDEAVARGIERLEQNAEQEAGGASAEGPPDSANPFANSANLAPGILGSTLNSDRRLRVSNTTTLTSTNYRTIGALNQVASAGYTFCTGTKVGPRAVLTNSHCVLSAGGVWTTSGWFHPGQTSTTHPNTSGTAVSWSGVYARDWRGSSNRRWDYAVVFLDDRADSYNLGWFGIAWWNSASNYNSLYTTVYGYPTWTSTLDEEKCKDSAVASKICDGWMYGHGAWLDSNAFRSDELLEYDIDTIPAQSGSPIFQSSTNTILGVHSGCPGFGGCGSSRNLGARFRTSMWNDVCSWIASVPSAHGSHGLCF